MKTNITPWLSILLALLFWGGFGVLVWQLNEERGRYSSLKAEVAAQDAQGRSAAELRTLLRDTREDRDALEKLSRTDVLAAAATIESVGSVVGIPVTIREATSGPTQGPGAKVLNSVMIVADMEGSLQSLLRAASLFESLPFPSSVESYTLDQARGEGKDAKRDLWRMTTRIRIVTPSDNAS